MLLAFSCKEDNTIIPVEEEIILLPDTLFSSFTLDSTILKTDSFRFSLNQIEYPDSIILLNEANYARLSSIDMNDDSSLCVEYLPKYGFLGIDTIESVFIKSNDTYSHITNIDTVKLIIRVVDDEYHRQLVGRWKLAYYSYGVETYHPEKGVTTIVEYDNNMQYRKLRNDSIIWDLGYKMGGPHSQDKDYFYVDFADGDYNICNFRQGRLRTKSDIYWFTWVRQ